jgi:polysaccharide chain length determinant protein (PEP-CTERM system associated)
MNDIKRLVTVTLDQVWRRRWLALAFAWGVCMLGWFAVALMPDKYVSEARFYVDTTTLLNPLLRGISVSTDDHRDQEVAIMQRTITSRPNLAKIAQMTDLDKTVHTTAGMQSLLKSLENRISIQSQGPNLFTVQFSDNSPTLAKNVVQALLTVFVENSAGNKREDIQTARSFIDAQIKDYEGQLKAAEQRLADFKVHNTGYFSSSSQTFAMRLEGARENIETLRLEYNDAIAQREDVKRQLAATPQFLAIDAVSPYAVVATGSPLQQRIRALQTQLDELKLQYTDKHPDVVRTKAALDALIQQQNALGGDSKDPGGQAIAGKAQIPNEVHSQLSLRLTEAETRVGQAKRKLEEAQALNDDLQKKATEAPKVEAEFTNLNRDYEVLKATYEGLLQRRESARVAAAADSTTEPVQFRLIAAPEVPARATGPKRALFNTLVLIFGIGAGVGFVVLLTKVEDRVATPEDLDLLGEYPILGCVSTVITAARQSMLRREMKRFAGATVGLAVLFLVLLASSPNFSAVLHKFGVWT